MFQLSLFPRHRILLLGATAIVTGLISPVMAQTAATPNVNNSAGTPGSPAPAPVEQVEVTGTRIAHTNANSANSVTTISSKEIAQSSAATIEDVLRKLPIIGTTGVTAATNNGGNGADCTDIRNLGSEEVLVLIDGKRAVQTQNGTFSCVDLNNIPLAMVDHIDVLKDGASTTYGADAVAGVINVVLKKNFTGTVAQLEGDLPTRGGGSTGQLSVTTGDTFDKGNFVLSADYYNRGAVAQDKRNWAERVSTDNIPATHTGSGFVPNGQLLTSDGGDYLADANGGLTPFTTADRFNFAPYQDMNTALEKESITASTHYDFNEYMTGYVQAFYTHKLTTEQLAPNPIVLTIPNGTPFNHTGGTNYLYQRALEFGNRVYQQSVDTFQTNVGLRGLLPYNVTYDAYYQYGRSADSLVTKNSTNLQILNAAIANGANPYSPSQDVVDASKVNLTDSSLYTLKEYGLDLSKPDVVALPYGDLGIAFGFDHRSEFGFDHPDNLTALGVTPGNQTAPTSGGFNVTEVYGEMNVPILKDVPFAKELSINLGGRYFTYNTFGSDKVWKISANWAPVSDVRFRANIGTAFRQPSINDAFGGQSQSQNEVNDPCDANNAPNYTASQLAAIATNCARAGIKPGFHQASSQINTVVGGNPNLTPERARTEGLGVVLKPHWLPQLAITADYYRTKIQDAILESDPQMEVDDCYISNTDCDTITRTGIGQISGINAILENLGVVKTDGIDFSVSYAQPLGQYGTLSLDHQLEYTLHYREPSTPGGPLQDFAGTMEAVFPDYAYPRVRFSNTATWAQGPLSVSYTTRFISGTDFQAPYNDPTTKRVTSVANVFYHDIEGTYNYKNMVFTAGVDNILDLPAPYVPDGTTNTNAQTYDVVGRLVYLKTSFKF